MTTTVDSPPADASYFSHVLRKDSRDGSGRSYLGGLIACYQQWETHRDPEALHHFSAYLFEGREDVANYERLCRLVEGRFLQAKAVHLRSVFPVLEDVRLLSTAARARGDLERYGMSLGLRARLWQKGVRRAEVGLVVLLGHRGLYSEAIANAVYGRSPREAFDILAMLLHHVSSDHEDALREIADALLDCVSRMDNEGQRAHHIHRALYAVRLVSESCAAELIQRCADLADSIADEFQHVVAYVLLVQQVAPLNLDTAEQLSRQVVRAAGEYFAGEGGDALLAIAAIGRGTEPSIERRQRLERLVELAERLEATEAQWKTVIALLLELHWEDPREESLLRALHAIEAWLAACPDERFSDCIKALLDPEPVRVNNAAAPYQGDGVGSVADGEIGVVEARAVGEAIRLCSNEQEIEQIISRLTTGVLQRISHVEDADGRHERVRSLLTTLNKLATTLPPAAGRRLLQDLERVASENMDSFQATQCGIKLATNWYRLGAPEQGRVLLRRAMEHLNQCQETVRVSDDEERSERAGDSNLKTAFGLLSGHLAILQDVQDLMAGRREETPSETALSQIASLTSTLAKSLQDIPAEYRLAAFGEIAAILAPNRPGYISTGHDEGAVACALADVDVDLARHVVEGIPQKDSRFMAGAAFAEHVGPRDPGVGIALIDRLAHLQASEKTAVRICEVCTRLHPFAPPQAFWEQLSSSLDLLEEHAGRTLAMHICAVRVAETSPRQGLEIARREWERCANRESDAVKNLGVMVSALSFVEGEPIDIKVLTNSCAARGESLGRRTKRFIRLYVVPRAARQDTRAACVLLQALGDLHEDLSSVTEVVLALLSQGHRRAALDLLRPLPDMLTAIPEEDRESALQDFLERLAMSAAIPHADEQARVWSWLLEQKTGPESAGLPTNAALFHVVHLAKSSPGRAIAEWFSLHHGAERIVKPLISVSLRASKEETIAAIAALPEGVEKATLMAAVYADLMESPAAEWAVAIPSPLPLLRHLPTPEAQGRLLSHYISLAPEISAEEAIAAIRALPNPGSREEALGAAIRRLGREHKDELLAIIAEAVGAQGRGLEEDSPDYSLGTWAQLAARLSFDAGVKIIQEIEDSFERRMVATEILESVPDITVNHVTSLLVGLDDFDKCGLLGDYISQVARRNLTRAEKLVDAFDTLDDSERDRCLESAREEHFKESIRRDPDGTIERIARLSDAVEQAEQLKTVLETVETVDHASVGRWHVLLGIVEQWSRSAQSPGEALDYEHIGEIARVAPDIAYDRILTKRTVLGKAEACMRLLEHISTLEHVALLPHTLDGYRRHLEETEHESAELRLLVYNEFRDLLKERIKQWDVETTDAAAPILADGLEVLPGLNGRRDELLLGLLNKVSAGSIDLLFRLYDMMESTAGRSLGRTIMARRLSSDGLEKFMKAQDAGEMRARTAPGRAAAVLGRMVEDALGVSLFPAAEIPEPVSPGATASELFSLILDAYPLLCRLPSAPRHGIRLEICRLLQRVLAPAGHDDSLATIMLRKSGSCEGMKADDAGTALAGLLSSLAGLPEDSGTEEAEAIIQLLTKGDPSQDLPPVFGGGTAPLQASAAHHCVEQLLLRGAEYPGNIPQLVEQLLSAWGRSYPGPDEFFVDSLAMLEEVRAADPRVRLHFGQWLLPWVESTAESAGEEDDDFKRFLPILRVFVASELFLPDYLDDCLQWMSRGLGELIAYVEAGELPKELFQSLTRIGYVLGKMAFLRGCPPEISARLRRPIQEVLLCLAELEYDVNRSTPGKRLTRVVVKSCRSIVEDLDGLRAMGADPNAHSRLRKLRRRRQALIKHLLNTLRSAPWKSTDCAGRRPSQLGGGDEDNTAGETEAVRYLYLLAGCLWKVGLEDCHATPEIVELICRLASAADVTQLENESDLFKVDECFELEMFVRILARVDREGALRFVEATAAHDDEGHDFGLFDELVVDDPAWVFAHVERIGTKDAIGKRVCQLLARMAAESPGTIQDVVKAVQRIMDNHDDWMFRSEISEALGTALAGIGATETGDIRRITPEFWARATIGAAFAKETWKRDPMQALKMIDELELADVRADALVQCAREMSSAGAEVDTLAEVRGLLAACQKLPGERERFKASREALLAAMRLEQRLERVEALDVAYSFLELFASAPPDWLRLAFVVAVPLLAEHLENEQISQIGKSMFSSDCYIDTQVFAVELRGG